MGQLLLSPEAHGQRIHEAREKFFTQGEAPSGLVDSTILRSWERCRRWGLEVRPDHVGGELIGVAGLNQERERNQVLLAHAQAIMEHLYEQIRHSGSMVILADMNGLLLQCVGDPEFIDRAGRVALQPGASWDESLRGTNAIGTALVEERSVEVFGAEHFMDNNGFLTCSASPLMDPQGRFIGVLNISGDYRAYQRHTLGLVRMSVQIVEKRLFESEYGREMLLCFHPRAEYLGSLGEGLAAISPDGQILAINQPGLELLGLRRTEVVRRDFSLLFETPLANLVDRLRRDAHASCTITDRSGRKCHARLRGELPPATNVGLVVVEASAPREASASRVLRPRGSSEGLPASLTLDSLGTGDARLAAAVDKARRILGRDIPILVQGESGAGKELFAKAFHHSGPRRAAPFIALNCAAIPETLIESELFGYQGGAFTGARKEGAVGKIQQAHGGTLFLDEIGDMPLHLQARLLRVLQERSVTPLGSSKAVPVDISLVCATHRRLKDEVIRGNFREDLFYRLNGLCVTLPALRERTDLRQLVQSLIVTDTGGNREIGVSETAMQMFERYSWPGNIRQLNNVIRVAIALLDEGENLITEAHLPEELLEAVCDPASAAMMPASAGVSPDGAPRSLGAGNTAEHGASLDEIEHQAILRMLEAVGGNISAAARKLGISRNTLYRKIGRL